jgi:hypothetical protein
MSLIAWFRSTTPEERIAILLVGPVGFLFFKLGTSGLMLAPIGWIGLYIIARAVYMDIFHPMPFDEPEVEGELDQGSAKRRGYKTKDVDVDEADDPIINTASNKPGRTRGPATDFEGGDTKFSVDDFNSERFD